MPGTDNAAFLLIQNSKKPKGVVSTLDASFIIDCDYWDCESRYTPPSGAEDLAVNLGDNQFPNSTQNLIKLKLAAEQNMHTWMLRGGLPYSADGSPGITRLC